MNFTVEEGVEIQRRQLLSWRSVLSAEAFAKLEQLCKADNHKAETGHDIIRGTDMDMIVYNKLMKHENY